MEDGKEVEEDDDAMNYKECIFSFGLFDYNYEELRILNFGKVKPIFLFKWFLKLF